jgi:hypothetical protein
MFGRPGKMLISRFGQRKWNCERGSSSSAVAVRSGPCWVERRPSFERRYAPDLAVVALEEVLADDLPVRLDLGLPARVVDERADIEAELGDLRRQRAERVRERLGVGRRGGEDERPPRVDGDGQEAEVVLREVRLLLAARRRAELAVEAVRPRVVRALERLARAFSLGDDVAAVAADVDEAA